MTVTAIRKDPQSRTMTVDAEFDASPERVWELWADPRQLERWWGPPTYPATFTKHDLAPGSRVEYHMTGPEGDQPKGYWDVLEADAPHRLVVRDGFSNDDGTPNDDMPRGEMRSARSTPSSPRMCLPPDRPIHRTRRCSHGATDQHDVDDRRRRDRRERL